MSFTATRPDPLEAAAKYVRHKSTCPGGAPYLDTRESDGATVVRCPGCLKYAFPIGAKRPDDQPAAAPPPARTRYRCATHGRHVTWKGTGCADCEAEHRARMAARIGRRRVEP